MIQGAVEHASKRGWSLLVRGRPGAALRGHVAGYAGYEEHSEIPLLRREIPSARASLIISFGPRIDVLGQGARTSFVAGVHEAPATTRFAGHQHGIQVDLTPLAAQRLLGVPMDTVGDPVVDLDAILGADAGRLTERLATAPDWPARFALLDAAIARRLAATPPPARELRWAHATLTRTRGQASIAALSAEVGWSERRLLRAFRHHVGVPPKTFARMLRFGHAVERLRRDGAAALGEIALDCGYYDQAHFNRDFRAFAGGPPSEYVRRLLPADLGLDGS